jgi:hypothetical protein
VKLKTLFFMISSSFVITSCGVIKEPSPQRSAKIPTTNIKSAVEACQQTADDDRAACQTAALVAACAADDSSDALCPTIAKAPKFEPALDAAPVYTPMAPSFLGFSQEWPWVSGMAGSPHLYSIFNLLRNGKREPLILRVGGADADAGYDKIYNPNHKEYNTPESQSKREGMARSYDRLAELKDKGGFKFIATVNLANRKAEIAIEQTKRLRETLGDALLSIEIGNEPGYYINQIPGYWPNKDSFYSDIVNEFDRIAAAIGCNKNCAGPSWGWIGLSDQMMRNYLKKSGSKMNFVTVHYYKSAYDPRKTDNDTVDTLIQDNNDVIQKWVKPQVAVGREFKIPVRIGESNAVSGGGNDGVSNSFAAAIWTLDTCLTMASAGIAGIDFHQGSYKYAMYERVTKPQGGSSSQYPLYQNFRVQPNFYGMLLFQMANRDGSSIRQLDFNSSLKVKGFHLVSKEGSRTVLINKDTQNSKTLTVVLPVGRPGSTGQLLELLAPGNSLAARSGITLAGQSYEGWGGAKSGQYQVQHIKGTKSNENGYEIFKISMKPASAVLFILN